jgi:hypothetical protein
MVSSKSDEFLIYVDQSMQIALQRDGDDRQS